jgi:hypothetical protein
MEKHSAYDIDPGGPAMTDKLKEHFATKAASDPGFAIAYAVLVLAKAQQDTAVHLKYLGVGDAATTMGAVEYLAQQLREGLDRTAEAISGMSEPLRSDHPLQGQTFEGLESALIGIADAIESASSHCNASHNAEKPGNRNGETAANIGNAA